ncbi:MAG: hypothetical protein KGL59_08750 [Acidobacteriota bacterium]|nr:hypothetical protein [Acidobacteriota bacterium]
MSENSRFAELLLGKTLPKDHIRKSRARLDAMFARRFRELNVRHKEHRAQNEVLMRALRKLVRKDPAAAAAVTQAKKKFVALAKSPLRAPRRSKVKPRAHVGTFDMTFTPPYLWPWQSSATTGPDATSDVAVDQNAGTMSFDSWTGDNGKTASGAVAVGVYYQPDPLLLCGESGVMNVSSNPAFQYLWDSSNFLDSSHTGAFIGIYVGEYTLGGDFVQAVVDQQISLWNSGGGSDQGANSGYPLFASTPVDTSHFYEIWVWSGGDAEADGWSAFWGSAALSSANLTVPSISIHVY